jgi:uncharacterized membrane protein
MSGLQRLGERFWFLPAILCLVAVVVAEGVVALDRRIHGATLPDWVTLVFYRVGESGSRDVLGAIATSSLSVAGTTFSITIAVLALTSSSYGPRLVRNFMADRGNQAVLGVLVATFLYALLVLRSVRVLGTLEGGDDTTTFVPHLAVNLAVVLAVVDVGVLVWFIHHISDSIQVWRLSGRVRQEIAEATAHRYPGTAGTDLADHAGPAPGEPPPPGTGRAVRAGRSGYVQAVELEALLRAAVEHDLVVRLDVRPGLYVVVDAPVAHLTSGAGRGGPAGADVVDTVRDAVTIADRRSPQQDVEFGVEQLVEMAVRALSPGTNDPFTASSALDDLSAALAGLVGGPQPSPERLDRHGTLRLYAPAVTDAELVRLVLDHVRWSGAAAPTVVHAALRLVRRVAARTQDAQVRQALRGGTQRLLDAVRGAGLHPDDVRRVEEHADGVLGAVAPSTP